MLDFIRKTLHFFDKLEDRVRARLSRMPIVYSLIGGVAIVLFWKGVWDVADSFPILFGPVSIIISVSVLLLTGLFASFFVGDVIIMSGLKQEKKLTEKAEAEIKEEMAMAMKAQSEIMVESETLKEMQKEIKELKTVIKEELQHHHNHDK